MLMAAVFALPAMAGWIHQKQENVTEQQSAFQSTSTMRGSGSPYCSNPAPVSEDGTTDTPALAPLTTAPRKAPGLVIDDGTGEPSIPGLNTPIGDAVLPMMLMAAAAAGAIALRRRKALVDAELGK